MKPVVALDFDGVICDSLDECLLTAYNAYNQVQGNSQWVEGLSGLDPEIVQRFQRLRYLVRPASEYWLLMHWLHTERGDIDGAGFNNLRAEYAGILEEFEPVFFDSRRALRDGDLERWYGLHCLYPQFLEGWSEISSRCSVHVVTTKDMDSVYQLSQRWGLDLEQDRLWTKERMTSKAEAVQQIAKEENCLPSEIAFVDDNLEHLQDVLRTGAKCYWATWGYTPENTVELGDGISRLGSLAELQ